jgi:hypothetical protein
MNAEVKVRQFKVECLFSDGWDDAGWSDTEELFGEEVEVPVRFDSIEEAQQAINEHVRDSEASFASGDLDEPYYLSEYRVVEVIE